MEDDIAGTATSHAVVPADAYSGRFYDKDDTATDASTRTWRQELPRWLASLNPGRTAREYEKAVRYFFDTPGVPQQLSLLSFDLLLAYRGALALRAAPRTRGASYAPRPNRDSHIAPSVHVIGDAVSGQALPPSERDERAQASGHSSPVDSQPLAPATVNLRLTALRQFLVHCTLLGQVAQLSPERIRAALRRLPIEHRRPYQILDEAEWEGFLRAALLPATVAPSPAPTLAERDTAESAQATDKDKPRGPWGIPRAARTANREDASTRAALSSDASEAPDQAARAPAPVRSRFGLTGIRTAQRDHALVALALATGLRAVELSQLDIGDLQREWHDGREEWWLVLPDVKTKGQKGGRTLPLAPPLVETLMAYVRTTGRKWEDAEDQAKPLFISVYEHKHGRRGGSVQAQQRPNPNRARLLPGQIARVVDRVEAQWLALRAEEASRGGTMQAGETRSISTHALRHSTAVALLAGNLAAGRPPASVEHVRGWLGHFDIRTTQGYLAHLDARRHRRPFALAPGSGPMPASAGGASDAQGDAGERGPSRAPDET